MDALKTFKETSPNLWSRYVADTWAIIKTSELEVFTVHTNRNVDHYISSTWEDLKDKWDLKKIQKKNRIDQENKAKPLSFPLMQQ